MSERRDPASYRDFDELMERLDSIVSAVRAKDVTIEESLDLLEEGIELGIRATDLVEKPDFTLREREELETAEGEAQEATEDEVAEAKGGNADAGAASDEAVSDSDSPVDEG